MDDQAELLSQGAEPRRVTGPPGRAARSARAVVAVVAGVIAIGSYVHWGHGTAARTLVAQTPGPTLAAAPPLAPRLHQVRVSTGRQSAEVTSSGHVELDLDLVNDGSFPLTLIAVAVPQPGVQTLRDTRGPVTYGSIADLAPGASTAVTLRLRLTCPTSASGPAADHLELTLVDDRGAVRDTSVDLRALPGFWDRVRHDACSAAGAGAVVDAIPTSVRWEDGTNGPLGS